MLARTPPAHARRSPAPRPCSNASARRRRSNTRARAGMASIGAIGRKPSIFWMRGLSRRLLQNRFRDERAHTGAERDEAGFARREWAGGVARRLHALLHALDEGGVFGVDLPVDAPVEETRRAHFAAGAGMHVSDFT